MKSFRISSVYWVFKSRRMRWVGHLAFMREFRNLCRCLVGRPRSWGRGHFSHFVVKWWAFVKTIRNFQVQLSAVSFWAR
jgi:hypothetical protein